MFRKRGSGVLSAEPAIIVCIATRGRPEILTQALVQIARQTRQPTEVLICPAGPDDVDRVTAGALPVEVRCIAPSSGLTSQRNKLLQAADAADVILFIDDDFLLSERYIERMMRKFADDPSVVCLTGKVLADGATNAGIGVTEALNILRREAEPDSETTAVFNAYGCNMALRWSALRGQGCWFDETLPLYGWLEDVDFSRQAAAFGEVRKYNAMAGVHLGVKQGRISGVRFGYSQIANQLYLVKKGTVTFEGAIRKVAENCLANLYGFVRGHDAYVDRRGRLKGNLIGLLDCWRGRSSPLRVLDL